MSNPDTRLPTAPMPTTTAPMPTPIAPVVLVAPHAYVSVALARPYVAQDPSTQAALEAHVAEWHDTGSREALDAAATELGAAAFAPPLPRGLMDLNRGWTAREEAGGVETLFGKPALGAWSRRYLLPGTEASLEQAYRKALAQIREACVGKRGLVELHSYGDLGSTYDKGRGGRPVRRPEAALVLTTPWETTQPVGLARLLPGDLRGTPPALERAVTDALRRVGITAGPSPYGTPGPWTVSMRFLAARWFAFLADEGLVPAATAARLEDLAWTDEQHAHIDAVATGQAHEGEWLGLRELAQRMGEWSHAPGRLGEVFAAKTGVFTAVVELRDDLVPKASDFGVAVARALTLHTISEGRPDGSGL